MSLVFRGRRILTRACATAASVFLVAHSSSVRTFPETLDFAVFFFFFFFFCTRFLFDSCGMSGALIRRTHARCCSVKTASKSCELGRKVAHGFSQLVPAHSLAHLWGSRVQRLLLTVSQNCRYSTDLLRPLHFFEEDFVGLLSFLRKGFCD